MRNGFVPPNRLYNVESRTPVAHPAHQATDEGVRRVVEGREFRIDGGRSLSATAHTSVRKSPFPQVQLSLTPIGRISPSSSTSEAKIDRQFTHLAAVLFRTLWVVIVTVHGARIVITVSPNPVGPERRLFPIERSPDSDIGHEEGDSR
ncbi:hypothetical protein [Natrinema halophilum]|uniref:hypothetical protein n=1 Tax=Natrinema halophilum TaxID=1699371 RepID=UPI001F45F850|nr:hypothetical protein [Natrinema halophilum]UHQ95989.1 hypothetical protein HYG82_21165 [Natrinema halophilum]